MPDILGSSGAGGSDAVVLENVSTRANHAESSSEEVPTEKRTNLGSINQAESFAEQTVEDDGSKQAGSSFAGQAMDGSFLSPGSTRFVPRRARFQLKGCNKFSGKKPGLDNEYAPAGTSCEKKPVATHCTCPHKEHEASSSDSSGIEHHMSPIPEGFTTKQDKARRVETWAIIHFSEIGAQESVRFTCAVRDACNAIQMDIKEMPLITVFIDYTSLGGIEDSLRNEYKLINTGVPRGKRLGLLIIVLPEVRDFDEKVEAVCKDLGVVYHCCFPQDIRKLNKQYLYNIACEINAKVLKCNSCCDYCKNIGLDGSSIEFCALDDEFEDYDSSSDEDMSSDSDDSYEAYCFEDVFLMEGDEDIPDTLVANGDSAEYNILEESGEPLPKSLDLVKVERRISIQWACISYSIMDGRRLFKFFSKLHAVFKANGMIEVVGSPNTAGTHSQTWSDLYNSTSKIFTRNRIKRAQIDFLLVILPECRDFDEEIEKFCSNLGVVYQLCLPINVIYPTNQHLKKYARQINFKVSKHDMAIPFVSEAPTILLGADIPHCAPEKGSRSVASVVASLDWPKVSQYGALVASQPHHEVVIRDLFNEYGGMVSNLILSFNWRTHKIPKRMIFFRHGIIEGQQDCALLEYVPTLTYVVVTQRFNMEFDRSGYRTKKRLRVQQGTSWPTKFEVLCDHGPCEATNMMVHYRVVHDENNLTAQELESIIIRLSQARDYQVHPQISMIPPAHFARHASHYERQPEAYDSRKGEGSCDVALPSLGGLVIKPYGDRQYWSHSAGLLFGAAAATAQS